MVRISSLAEAIQSAVRDGDTMALEGFTHLIPHAAGHEIIRQGRKRLTLIRMTPDLIYDQLIGMGCVDKLIFSWGGNPGVGSLYRFRDAVENGWPQKLELEEHSHAAMANAYEAGAAGLPCAVFRGYIGGDLPKVNAKIKYITCPFTGEKLAAIPAHRPDVAVIHAQRADKHGNVLIEGVLGVQKEAVLASKRSVVTVEEIVDDLGERSLNAVVLPHWTVGHVVEVPGGAFPSYAQGYYPRHNGFYKEWDAIAKERDSFLAWMKTNVLDKGPDAFAQMRVKSARRRSEQHGRLQATRDDDRRGGARAQERRHLLRGHRATFRRLQFRTPHPRAGYHADLRIRHACNQAEYSAALDRRRRIVRDGADHRVGAGNVPLLAARRPHQHRFSRRRADRQIRQSQYDGGRLLRQAEGAAARRRRRAGDRTSCGEIFIIMAQGKRSFVDKLDFVTSIGHVSGGDSRARLGVATKGPTRLITDLALFEPDPETKEMTVVSIHPGVTREQMQENSGWKIRFASKVAETPPPTARELEVLRDLHARTDRAHSEAA